MSETLSNINIKEH